MKIEDSKLKYETAVSLRLRHPSMDCSQISEPLGLSPSLCREVGDQRRTPKGDVLEGINSETYWLHRFDLGDSFEIEDCMEKIISNLLEKVAFFKEFSLLNGRGGLYVGIFLNENSGFELTPNTLKGLNDLGLTIGFDLYPKD